MKLELKAALVGDLPGFMKDELERGAAASSGGVLKTMTHLKEVLRAQVLSAFGSQRLANTWRGDMFPRPPKTSLGAAATVYSNAPHIIAAFSASTVIRSQRGVWLAIPSPDCPRGPGGRRLDPSNFPEDRFGKLHFVYRPGKASLLVVDEVGRTASGKVSRQKQRRKDGSFKQGTVSVVMFFLVPFVSLRQALNLEAAYAAALDELTGNIVSEWNRLAQA
ncbi:MAG: hypothetical protein HY834_08930 [Devosia nanyangense]|uniref:Uncharacterized protein n=1 Tax=Devosia nanyangense TaxID=1228055 RepID=A0A933NY38_9HYPH|nr:hypothetical protein [Devosia nanyangense]